ncbi:MAG TPA: Ppx/GppA phosphatase family protein [Acidimicrobiales bacterium]|nr:Ppx/GppA phosphatase family protein [Acidimicrobiales bacterium]
MTARAAIDIGTNSVRLLAVDGDRDLERRAVITRIGEGVDRAGELSDAAMERTLAALIEFRDDLDARGVERLRVVATSAARDAANRDTFFDAVADVLGTRPELLTGDEEARLSFAGAVSGLDPESGPFVVIDIGGGSTELAVGTTTADGVHSMNVGAVRITEAELHHDPPQPEELTNALGVVEDRLDDAVRLVPAIEDLRTLVGVGGTITSVAAIEIGLAVYDRDRVHHFRLTRAAAEDVFRTLATEPLADRRHNPGLQPGRADIIVGGCVVLVAIMRKLRVPELVVCDADLLDALVGSAP